MVGGIVLIVIVFTLVRQVAEIAFDPALVPVFRIVTAAVLVGALFTAGLLWSRIPALRDWPDQAAWWREQAGRAVVVWALAEGAAMMGGVVWFLTGDPLILVGVTGAALAMLVMYRPGRLAER